MRMDKMNLTGVARLVLDRYCRRADSWDAAATQERTLRDLLRRAHFTLKGFRHDFTAIANADDVRARFARDVEPVEYEDIRQLVMRMVRGEKDVLWPGRCLDFAQSSGTSGGKSKYIPITPDSLQRMHYAGASFSVAFYLRNTPESRMFQGKGFILGGSFANELELPDRRVRVGDLSATLINKVPLLASLIRIPDKRTALMPDWHEKLPELVRKSAYADVTNISGVPSWFLAVIRGVLAERKADKLHDVWPNLEVFFHGGISFEPYRKIYEDLTDPSRMHFYQTYNASEGFFATQDRADDPSMLLLLDNDVYYEFIPLGKEPDEVVNIENLEAGKVYELMITGSNGLWRYRIGDTVRVVTVNPVRIEVAGRTKRYLNAFGEELMENNAERAVAATCAHLGCAVSEYTVAPVFADKGRRGRHQWLIEWQKAPRDMAAFAAMLDRKLRDLNSDYDAKRSGGFFMDEPEIVTLPQGTFHRWLESTGNHKLGGQKKIPRLSNDRTIADAVLALSK